MPDFEKPSGQIALLAAALIALGGLGLLWARRQQTAEDDAARGQVRDAGPENMEAPPRRWDMVDETSDQSFPASDPPGGY